MGAGRTTAAVAALALVIGAGVVLARWHSAPDEPKTFADCVLTHLPGAANDTVAKQLAAQCRERFPQSGLFDDLIPRREHFADARACALAKASSTPSEFGALLILASCNQLYPKQ